MLRGSTFCFVVVVVVVADALLNYCEFRHGCTSGSCVSRQIESRQCYARYARPAAYSGHSSADSSANSFAWQSCLAIGQQSCPDIGQLCPSLVRP
jgi:hypothetical protein